MPCRRIASSWTSRDAYANGDRAWSSRARAGRKPRGGAVAAVVLAREMRAERPRYCSLTGWLGNVVLFGSLFVFVGGELGPALDESLGLSAVFVFVIGHVISLVGDECDSRARHVQVFDRIAEVIDGVVVGHHQLRGRYGAHPAEVILRAGSFNGTTPSSQEVALTIVPGGADWLATFGRLPGARRTKGWYVQSDDRVVAEQLTQLGVPTLLQHRYDLVGQRLEAKRGAPEVRYSAESGRLRYLVRGGGWLTSEHLRAQLDLLTCLGTLDARANADPPGEARS
jgi:hypothetical protein